MKKITAFLCLILPFLEAIAQPTLDLIPTPREISLQTGTFQLEPGQALFVEKPVSSESDFAIRQLETELRESAGIKANRSSSPKGHTVCLGMIRPGNKISAWLRELKMELPESGREEGYLLKVEPGRILLGAYTEAGLFYGVQTLRQLIRSNRNSIPCVTITDWPALRYRGWMDDISRGPVPTVDFVKQCIRTLSEYKLNYFTLYTEHTFKLEKYPDIAPPGTFTASEIKELTDYAALYHMDIIGNFQSFGHMEKILANPFYAGLRESGNILNPADEATYRFLGDIYSEIVPAYKSPFFNINCDETQGLGEGKSRAMADSIGTDGIYAYHINRINDLMKPYGKRLMMWGDIAVNNQKIISRLPRDLVILSWGYGAAESFDEAIIPFKETGFDFMVAPGVGCWGELWPAMTNAVVNISNYVRDGAKLGAMGMMNTAWDDNGHNLFNYNWHGLVWGAECSWNPASPLIGDEANRERTSRLERFNTAFDELFFRVPGITEQLILIDSLRFMNVKGIVGEGAFWQNILDFYPDNTNETVIAKNQAVINQSLKITERLQQSASSVANKAMPDGALLALKRIRFTAHKNIARAILYKAYQSGDPTDIQSAGQHLSDLIDELFEIKKEYIRLWNLENRPWWLDKNLNDYNRQALQLQEVGDKVFIEPVPAVVNNKRPVILRTLFNDRNIIYTLNGTEPTIRSERYTDTLMIEGNVLIKAAILNGTSVGAISEKTILMHKGIGHFRKLNSKYSDYNPAYAGGGEQALVDGIQGSENFADGHWQGFQGRDVDIELDFGKVIPVTSLSAGFLQNSYSWILLPSQVELLTSSDGVNYQLQTTITHDVPQQDQKTVIHTFTASFDKLNCRYLKVIARNAGVLPAWHHAPGNPSFIFADEIIVK